jgi:hypothetical protein
MSEETKKPVAPSLSLDNFRCGYIIAIDKDGEYSFRVFGQEPGTIELLGLHEIAHMKLHEPFERGKLSQLTGLLEQTVKVLNELMTVETPPPDVQEYLDLPPTDE